MRRTVLLVALVMLTASAWSTPTLVVIPSSLAATEGNINNGFPFNIARFGRSSMRYQQVYEASDFPSMPMKITKILFRPDANAGAFSSTIMSIQINLSTTAQSPDGLSGLFASNVGFDDTLVHMGPLPLSSSFTGPAAGPKDFDIVIVLQTPFVYDPAAGNLLLDVRNFSGDFTTQFDADDAVSDPVSRLFSIFSDGVEDSFGTGESVGLVTAFETEPAELLVAIDIKPGSDPNSINTRSRGLIPVAILGSGSFDNNDVDVTTITFGPGAASPVHGGHPEDVNDDGFFDLVLHFRTQESGLQPGDTDGCLTGNTLAGLQLQGCDAVRIVQ